MWLPAWHADLWTDVSFSQYTYNSLVFNVNFEKKLSLDAVFFWGGGNLKRPEEALRATEQISVLAISAKERNHV